MDPIYITEIFRAVAIEFRRFRRVFLIAFVVVSFSVLLLGVVIPKYFETSAMLQADVTNIMQPDNQRSSGRGVKTDIAATARELIYLRKNLESVARQAGMLNGGESLDVAQKILKDFSDNIKVTGVGNNYFRVTYSDPAQDQSFSVLNKVIDHFIKTATDTRRSDSRAAYEFVSEQVESYKRQLQFAEDNLKEFQANNVDGTETGVSARIRGFRSSLEELSIQIDEAKERQQSLEEQLADERRYLVGQDTAESYRKRISTLQANLDNLLLNYQDTYPDVIIVREQIAELKEQAKRAGVVNLGFAGGSELPLYEELRKRLAEVEESLSSLTKRRSITERLLAEEEERGKRVAANQAQLTELTRDYGVTRKVYEQMLERKEKARLAMTLDIEGQGISYRIQEPAIYPLKPAGLQVIHYAAVGPILGLLLPFGLLLVFVLLDPHVRLPHVMADSLEIDLELLAVIPYQGVPEEIASLRKQRWRTLAWLGLAMFIYVAFVLINYFEVL